jgi:hypothetical protein
VAKNVLKRLNPPEAGAYLSTTFRPVGPRPVIPHEYEGVTYPSRGALARHFAEMFGVPARTVELVLERLSPPDAALYISSGVGKIGRPGNPIDHEGVRYPSLSALARHFAETFSVTVGRAEQLLRRLGPPEAARRLARPKMWFVHDGVAYPSRGALARHLARTFGVPAGTVWAWLERNNVEDAVRRCEQRCAFAEAMPGSRRE